MENKEKVNKIYERIKSCIPVKWATIIKRQCVNKKEQCMPEVYVMEDEEKCKIKDMSVKKVYRWLIVDVLKQPAAENVWCRVFEDIEIKKIWSNLNVKYNSIECENNDFLIRHNRIYTNVVLNKINKNANVMCDVCSHGHENFLHYFLECDALVDFFNFLKELLKENWDVEFDSEEGWKKMFLFGLFERREKVKFCLVNFVLIHARLAVILRRNFAHFEGRAVKIKVLFKAIMKRDVELICKYGGKEVK